MGPNTTCTVTVKTQIRGGIAPIVYNEPINGLRCGPGGSARCLPQPQIESLAMGATHVEFREGMAESLPLADDCADVVISNGVLNMRLDKATSLAEWRRILKPGGR
jgi:SAM-dependent methyltransferase